LRDNGLRETARIEYRVPGGRIFGVKTYADKLDEQCQIRNVNLITKSELISINIEKKSAKFKNLLDGKVEDVKYDLLHVAPPMSAPDFIKRSPISDEKGWVDVDMHTLQSVKYPNIFGIGDCTNTPNSKTAAAVISQAPVLVHNLRNLMEGRPLDGIYHGNLQFDVIITIIT